MLEQLTEDCGGGWRVRCYGCSAEVQNRLIPKTKEEVINTWNSREQCQSEIASINDACIEICDSLSERFYQEDDNKLERD
jgi:hypothetical protein